MNTPPLKVLFLTPYFRPYLGGIERAVEQLSFNLLESGRVASVAVLTTKYAFPRIPHPEWSDYELSTGGIEIYRINGYPMKPPPVFSVPLVWFAPLQIKKILNDFDPDVVHFVGDGWFVGHLWCLFWFKNKAKFIFTPSYHKLSIARWWLRPINGVICSLVDKVVSLSNLEADRVGRDYWVNWRKKHVIGWGATPLESFGSNTKAFLTESGGQVPINILCVGRLGDHKGQYWLLEIYKHARKQFNQPARLIFVGRDEGGESALREEVKTAGLEDEVIFAGELDDGALRDWYTSSELFVLFSRYEAFGLVFFEAMIAGVPVLTHDVGANKELLLEGAIVIPRFDQNIAILELVNLVNNDVYRRRLGQEGKNYSLKEFSWNVVSEKYLKIYTEGPIRKDRWNAKH